MTLRTHLYFVVLKAICKANMITNKKAMSRFRRPLLDCVFTVMLNRWYYYGANILHDFALLNILSRNTI